MIFRYPFIAMGSGCEFLIERENQLKVIAAVKTALSVIKRLEEKYSLFKDKSFLSRINGGASRERIMLDEETAWLLGIAGELHGQTGGCYDPTVGGLQGCWDFQGMGLPDGKELKARLEGVGWKWVELSNDGIRFHHPRTRIDLGGLVKEYAVDCAVAALQALGVTRGLVNMGGDLRLVGKVGFGERPFRVGVANPRRHHHTLCTLALKEGAVVSSGDYQRYFIRDGIRYHHLLDPKTGYPLELEFSGVTTTAPTALEALKTGKRALLGENGLGFLANETDSAYLICDLSGAPVAWRETTSCSFKIQPPSEKALAG